jgi:hypothetical protein
MYFMVGLPTETDEDVAHIAEMGARVKSIGRKYVGKRARVRVSTSNHVPKPHTPFQWARQEDWTTLTPKHRLLRDACRASGVEFSWNDPRDSFLECVLSRGDRRVAEAVEGAWRRGARFDAWSEHFKPDVWDAALAEQGIDPAWYAHREWDDREPLPWDHVESGVNKAYLRGQWRDVLNSHTVADCHHGGCNVCGMQNFPVADCQRKLGELIAMKQAAKKFKGEALELV